MKVTRHQFANALTQSSLKTEAWKEQSNRKWRRLLELHSIPIMQKALEEEIHEISSSNEKYNLIKRFKRRYFPDEAECFFQNPSHEDIDALDLSVSYFM